MTRRLLLIAGLIAVASIGGVVLVSGGGESGPSALLSALRNDPMARYEPPGAQLTATREQDQGSAMGKGFLVTYARDFTVPGEDAEAALAAARRAAREAGWRSLGPPSQPSGEYGTTNGSVASRTVLGDQPATLTIVLSTPPGAGPSTPRKLQIDLTS